MNIKPTVMEEEEHLPQESAIPFFKIRFYPSFLPTSLVECI